MRTAELRANTTAGQLPIGASKGLCRVSQMSGRSGVAAHFAYDGQQISQLLLARRRVWSRGTQRLQRLVDGFFDDMPVGCRAGFQTCLGVVPGGFEVLDPCLRSREVTLVSQHLRVGGDLGEGREVA